MTLLRTSVVSCLVLAMLSSTTPSPLYELYEHTWRITASASAAIFAAYAFGVIILLPIAGRLSDLFGRRPIILCGLALIAIGSWLLAEAWLVSVLIAGRILSGLGTAALTGAANSTMVEIDLRHGFSRSANTTTIAYTSGCALGPIITSICLWGNWSPERLPFQIILISSIVVAICVSWSPEFPAHRRVNGGQAPNSSGTSETLQGTRFAVACGGLVLAWASAAVFAAAGPSFAIPLLSARERPLAGLIAAAFQFAAGLSQFTISRLDKPTLTCASLVLAGFLFLAAGGVATGSTAMFFAGTVGAGCAYGATFVSSVSIANMAIPSGRRGWLTSLFFASGYISIMFSSMSAGAIIDIFGKTAAILTFAGMSAILATLVSVLDRLMERRSARDLLVPHYR